VAVLVLKVLPQREAAIKEETGRSPREGGVTGASRIVGVVEELCSIDTFFHRGMMDIETSKYSTILIN
jgi:hypothetical protein